MKPGKAIAQTWTGTPEWRNSDIFTMSPGGVGALIDCWKCEECGWSVDRGGECLAYSELYDARYVIATGQWVEEKCNDADCRYCKDRPEAAGFPP